MAERTRGSYLMDFTKSIITPELEELVAVVPDYVRNTGGHTEPLCSLFEQASNELGWWSGINEHSRRVGMIARDVAECADETEFSLTDYYWGGVLHDIGNVKETKTLSHDEFMVLMRTHAPLGALILDRLVDIVPLGEEEDIK